MHAILRLSEAPSNNNNNMNRPTTTNYSTPKNHFNNSSYNLLSSIYVSPTLKISKKTLDVLEKRRANTEEGK